MTKTLKLLLKQLKIRNYKHHHNFSLFKTGFYLQNQLERFTIMTDWKNTEELKQR